MEVRRTMVGAFGGYIHPSIAIKLQERSQCNEEFVVLCECGRSCYSKLLHCLLPRRRDEYRVKRGTNTDHGRKMVSVMA